MAPFVRLVSNYTAAGVRIELQSENGLLGIGPYPTEAEVDPDLINAGKERVSMSVSYHMILYYYMSYTTYIIYILNSYVYYFLLLLLPCFIVVIFVFFSFTFDITIYCIYCM